MKKKIAIVHPKLGWGGSEVTVLYAMEALKSKYDLYLITSQKVDIESLNRYYGTALNKKDFSLIKAPMPFFLRNTEKFAALRGRFIQRYCQKITPQFDLIIGAYNQFDFKTHGVQFATDIAELPEIISLNIWKKLWYKKTIIRKIYLKICDLVSPESISGWKNNSTFANSKWTADLMKKRYGIEPRVLYPPAIGDFSKLSRKKKENGFICVGRITLEKKFEEAISILEKVRQKNNDIRLYIVGRFANSRYARKLKKKCLAHKNWIFIKDGLSQKEKNSLLASCRFGISCRKNEPFGVAIAEMAKAGCIVFVPNGGGQTEIVENPELIYENIEDAVLKIDMVINDEKLQKSLVHQLSSSIQRFSVEKFRNEICKMVENELR